MDRRPIAEIGVSLVISAICAVFWIEAAKLPPGSFEPLGSGPVPKYTAIIVILCCAVVIVRALRQVAAGPGLAADFRAEFAGGSPIGALVLVGLTLGYALVLHFKLLAFGVVTAIYLFLLIWLLEDMRWRAALPAAIVAAVAAFGVEYLFTRVFIVDLPA